MENSDNLTSSISSNQNSKESSDTTARSSQQSTLLNTTSNGGDSSTFFSNTTEHETNSSLTDITSTTLFSSSALTETDIEKSHHVTRELLLKKQLLHDIQKLKIELSQKDLLIDTIKAENLNRIDDLEDKLSDALHEKQIVAVRYENKLRAIQDQYEKQIKSLKTELHGSLELQKKYQRKCKDATSKLSSTKENLVDVQLEESDYLELKGKSEETLSTQELFAVKLYENNRPLKVQIETLMQRIDILTSDLKDREDDLEVEKREHEEEHHVRSELDVRCQHFQVQIQDLRAQLSHKSYKNQNFDVVQSERDSLERRIVDFEKTCTVLKLELDNKVSQLETLRGQMQEQNQRLALLLQDKDYLAKQVSELTPRYRILEERFEKTCKQLDDVKQAREELYEKYLNSREHYKQEYEERMKRELDELSSKTNMELNRIKESTSELYERENRNLRESKNTAILEQDRLLNNEKVLQAKHNELIGEFRQLQISSDGKLAESQNELKLKSFELDRIQMLYEEALSNIKKMGLQNETIAKKLETVNKEYYALKGSSERRITEIQGHNNELRSKVTIYEKLEQELDDVVMQAAEMANEVDSERVLFAYGYGANVPSTAKRRMQQSVQLARRVLQLERANTSLRHNLDREEKKKEQIAEELKNSTQLLNDAQQPYNYLIDSIRTREEHNKTLKCTISTLESDIKNLKRENVNLQTSNNQMTTDLERLLNQREEMNVLKQVVLGLKSTQHDSSAKEFGKSASVVYGPHVSGRTSLRREPLESVNAGKPLVFTNTETPIWYEKLKRKNAAMERK